MGKYKRGVEMMEKILQVAKTSFRNHGYKESTIERIANLAGVPASLVTYYFKKEEFLLRIYRDYWLSIIALIDREAGKQCENKFQWYLLFTRIFYSSLVSETCNKDIYWEIFLRRLAHSLLREYNDPLIMEIIAEFGLETDETVILHCMQAEYGARREVLFHNYINMHPERDKETFYFLACIAVRMAGLDKGETKRHIDATEALYEKMGKPIVPLL